MIIHERISDKHNGKKDETFGMTPVYDTVWNYICTVDKIPFRLNWKHDQLDSSAIFIDEFLEAELHEIMGDF